MILAGLAIYSITRVTTRETNTSTTSGRDEEIICVPNDQVNFISTEERQSDTVNFEINNSDRKDIRTSYASGESNASVNHV